MTYNEWRDELKNNLLCATETERRRVLDYYAEAYADRRDAGYSERQIIEDFGAPYDAAQRILLNICDEDRYEEDDEYCERHDNYRKKQNRFSKHRAPEVKAEAVEPQPADNKKVNRKNTITTQRKAHPFLFLLLCVLLAIPMFVVVVTLGGISIGFIVAPIVMLISGVASVGFGIFEAFSDVLGGVFTIGEGLIALGLGIILTPLIIRFLKFLWKLLKKFVIWLGSIFSGKETRV